MIFSISMFIISLLMLYQGAGFFGYFGIKMVILNKFKNNSMLMVARAILGKYLIVLGVFGVLTSLALGLWLHFKGTKEDKKLNMSYWGIFIGYVLILIFTVI